MLTHVIFNSKNLISGNTQSASYMVDWNAILKPNTQYLCHFTYIGGANVYTGTKLACVYVDFNSQNIYQNLSSANGASTSQMIGFLKPIVLVGSSNTCYLQSETITNEEFLLTNRPSNGMVNIRILDNSGLPFLDNAGTPAVPSDYVLTLHFREIVNQKLEKS